MRALVGPSQKRAASTHLIGEGCVERRVELRLVLGHEGRVNLDLRGSEGRGGDKLERLVADELAGEPEEGLLEVVLEWVREMPLQWYNTYVRLGRDLEVLEVLCASLVSGTASSVIVQTHSCGGR